MSAPGAQRRALLPPAVFALTLALHLLWSVRFPAQDPAQTRWAAVAPHGSTGLSGYLARGDYWLGLTYSLALAFAAAAFVRYRATRRCEDRRLALGGVGVSGFLAAAGCFLVGCCGSPMLAVYAALLGSRVVPLAKPGIFLLTAGSLALVGWRSHRAGVLGQSCAEDACCGSAQRQAGDSSDPMP